MEMFMHKLNYPQKQNQRTTNMKRYPLRLIIVVLLFLAVTAAAATTEQAEVKADSLTIQSDTHTARFEGNVRANFDGLRFYCSRMIVAYDDTGQIVSFRASGKVTVLKGGAKAVAQYAVMNVAKGKIVLSGKPQLTRGGNTLSGNTIEVNMETGKIQITEAVGTFVFSRGHHSEIQQ